MTEQNNISEPFQNAQNQNENVENQGLINEEILNKKQNKVKIQSYIVLAILTVLEIVLEIFGVCTYKLK